MGARVPLVALASLMMASAVACGGGSGEPTATPSAVEATATPQIIVPVPDRPAAFEDYPQVIADYLTEAGKAALGPPCLAELVAAWQMPAGQPRLLAPLGLPTTARCVLGNTDTDPDDEVVVALSASHPELSSGNYVLTNLVILDRTEAGYRLAFESAADEPQATISVPDSIVRAEDLNSDGAGELAFARITCGAHTCTWAIHIVTGEDSSYRPLTPEEGLTMATAEVRVRDTDGDGTKEIVLHGGIIQSVGAGPQRQRTDVYAWDGQQYSLRSTEYDPSDLRYFRVRDADEAFSNGDYEEAARLYQEAISDPYLGEVEYFGSRDELMAYAMFRLGLSYLKLGNTMAASKWIEEAIANYPVSLHGDAAVAFRNTVNLTRVGYQKELSDGCHAVATFLNQNIDRFREIWNYGYANPEPEPEQVCPF